MFARKTLIAFALTLVMVVLPVASVYAAPAAQTATAVDCTVQSISVSTDSTSGVTSVQVTCADGTTASLTTDEALALGLVTQNPDGTFTANDAMIGQVVSITPTEDPCASTPTSGDTTADTSTTEESANPVGEALVGFFCESAGLTSDTLQTYRDQGMGYGVIAQACFMAQILGDDCSAVLDAKLNGDYSGLTLPEGTEVTNWGQLRKVAFGEALFGKGPKNLVNLGAIMSGRAAPEDLSSDATLNDSGAGRDHGNNGRGQGQGKGKGQQGKP